MGDNKDFTFMTQREMMDMFVRDKMREKELLKQKEIETEKEKEN